MMFRSGDLVYASGHVDLHQLPEYSGKWLGDMETNDVAVIIDKEIGHRFKYGTVYVRVVALGGCGWCDTSLLNKVD